MPDHWRKSKWGDEVTLQYGKAIRGYQNAKAPYRVFGSNGPVGWHTEALAPGPGVILGRKGAYRGVRYSPEPFFVIDTAYYVQPKGKMDMRWLYYAVIYHRLGEIDDGSPIPSTTRAAVYVRDMEVPPIKEQRAIAELLGSLDDKIELNRRMNETLEEMAQAIFRDWFIDFGPTRRKIDGATDPVETMGGLVTDPDCARQLADQFPANLADDGLPKGWEAVAVSHLVEFNPSEPLRRGTVAPYSDMSSLPTRGSIAELPIDREFGSGMRFRNGDALIARITPCLENGKAAFVDFLPDQSSIGWGSTEFIVLRAKAPVPPPYSYLIARQDEFRDRAIRSMTGTSGRQRAQADSVSSFVVARASDEVLEAFGQFVVPWFSLISANGRQNRTLAATRDLLLPKLMSGETRLRDAAAELEAAQ
ncbi:restriction endonuclease subunit S [Mesorhizobium sp. ES1-3]|uniref:restriction endonuclease subunit S n=1 Tax=Mesorhizobium sp. ES1-3 TaxID=2876628 RepID=UPI001CCEA1F2|nr:restriction endonuclease subunit S [Mesorhizobium sp. ES1-3]MBZ9669526.1 restriction endonuclease subunit S [Mesorhizobium sp. ES1-3]